MKNLFNSLFILLVCLLVFQSNTYAQEEDTVIVAKIEKESIILKPDYQHEPHKATLYATILPGAGQIYNKQTWKVPILYAGLGTLAYFMSFNNNRYLEFKDSFIAKRDGRFEDDRFPSVSQERIQINKDYFKRNRDLLIIISVLVHGLNIVDATVFAHLKSFDVNDNLSFKIEPSLSQMAQDFVAGVRLKINFSVVKK